MKDSKANKRAAFGVVLVFMGAFFAGMASVHEMGLEDPKSYGVLSRGIGLAGVLVAVWGVGKLSVLLK